LATINSNIEDSLLIISVTGDLTADDILAVVSEHYQTGLVKDVIWDLTHGTTHSISQYDFEAMSRAIKVALAKGLRQGGKTAIVGNDIVEYGLMRMYSVLVEITEVHIEYNVFKTLEEAKNSVKG